MYEYQRSMMDAIENGGNRLVMIWQRKRVVKDWPRSQFSEVVTVTRQEVEAASKAYLTSLQSTETDDKT